MAFPITAKGFSLLWTDTSILCFDRSKPITIPDVRNIDPQATDRIEQLVYLARQLQIGLGRDASRASHALAAAQPVDAAYAATLQLEYPQLQRYTLDLPTYTQGAEGNGAAQLWIIDPHGNLVLRYGPGVIGKDVLNDLRLLLKLSNIG